jgi:sugar phosphate isomerase/epimerase
LVSREHRQARIQHLKKASDFAKRAGIPAVETHVGFIPESPRDPLYAETVTALKEVVGYCRANGQQFLYHAGQETAITLLRTILDVGFDNQRVGLDTANPVMYGKGNPVDSVEVLGKYLGLVNFKDGLWPVNGKDLGREMPIPQGKVEFPRLVRKLKEVGYPGPMIIEREISGPQLLRDVRASRDYIEGLLNRP